MRFFTLCVLLINIATTSAPTHAAENIGDFSVIGRPILLTAPEYPKAALESKVSGELKVEIDIDKEGVPLSYRIISSKPEGVFDASFAEVYKWWFFHPGLIDCQVTPSVVRSSINYDVIDGKPKIHVTVGHDLNVNQSSAGINKSAVSKIYSKPPLVIYPQEALDKEMGGLAIVRFERNDSGEPVSPSIAYSYPREIFDEASLKGVRRARLLPYQGEPGKNSAVCQIFIYSVK